MVYESDRVKFHDIEHMHVDAYSSAYNERSFEVLDKIKEGVYVGKKVGDDWYIETVPREANKKTVGG